MSKSLWLSLCQQTWKLNASFPFSEKIIFHLIRDSSQLYGLRIIQSETFLPLSQYACSAFWIKNKCTGLMCERQWKRKEKYEKVKLWNFQIISDNSKKGIFWLGTIFNDLYQQTKFGIANWENCMLTQESVYYSLFPMHGGSITSAPYMQATG